MIISILSLTGSLRKKHFSATQFSTTRREFVSLLFRQGSSSERGQNKHKSYLLWDKGIRKIESRHDDNYLRVLYCDSDRAKSSNRPAKSGSVFYHMINALKKLRLLPAAGVLTTPTPKLT